MIPLVACIGSCRLKTSLDYLKKNNKIKISQIANTLGWTYYTKETIQLLKFLKFNQTQDPIPSKLYKWIFRKAFFLRFIDKFFKYLQNELLKADVVIIEISSLKKFQYSNFYFNLVNINDYMNNFLGLNLSNLFHTHGQTNITKTKCWKINTKGSIYNLDMIEAYYKYRIHRKNMDKRIRKNIRKKNIDKRFIELITKINYKNNTQNDILVKTRDIKKIQKSLSQKFKNFVEDLKILNNVKMEIQSLEEVVQDIKLIKKLVGNKKLIILSHYNYAKYDIDVNSTSKDKGRLLQSRTKLIQYLEAATKQNEVAFINPTDIIGQEGTKDSEHLSGEGIKKMGNYLASKFIED